MSSYLKDLKSQWMDANYHLVRFIFCSDTPQVRKLSGIMRENDTQLWWCIIFFDTCVPFLISCSKQPRAHAILSINKFEDTKQLLCLLWTRTEIRRPPAPYHCFNSSVFDAEHSFHYFNVYLCHSHFAFSLDQQQLKWAPQIKQNYRQLRNKSDSLKIRPS
jgi:hypothetical protein